MTTTKVVVPEIKVRVEVSKDDIIVGVRPIGGVDVVIPVIIDAVTANGGM